MKNVVSKNPTLVQQDLYYQIQTEKLSRKQLLFLKM